MIDGVLVQGNKVDNDLAKRLAAKFSTEVINSTPEKEDAVYFLLDKTGLSFIIDNQVLKGDFTRLLSRISGGHLQHEILLKAAKPEGGEKAVDATAGLGEDSFILAAGGYEVEMFEHNPVTFSLLSDALIRARKDPKLKDIAKRMSLKEGDSKELLSGLTYSPNLIYLDPMFPEKKKSAETKKKLQVLHRIELPCSDENELLKAAISSKPKKIIIKRPPDGDFLGAMRPTYSIERKAVRFDCIALSQD